MGTAILATIATIVAGAVAGLTGWLTAKASAKGAVKAAQVTSLTDLEREAGIRMAAYYKGAIDDLKAEQAEDRAELVALRAEVKEVRGEKDAIRRELDQCKDTCRVLLRRTGPQD